MVNWESSVKDQLIRGKFEVAEVYDDGRAGSNEVARLKLEDGKEVVQKVMLRVKKYHQSRKALTEVIMYLLDINLGGAYIVPKIYAEEFKPYASYSQIWQEMNVEGHDRICNVVRGFAPGWSGEDWRGKLYSKMGDLERVDAHIKDVIEAAPTGEKMAVLDFLTVNQDRSARNWVSDGKDFYAIDNGMAWFHEFPKGDWRAGCVIDDVLIQKGPWKFIAGIFTTSFAGRDLSLVLHKSMFDFNRKAFLYQVGLAAEKLGFPSQIQKDWRFEGILRRLDWIVKEGRFPTADEYRQWREDSDLMTPERIVKSGGREVWKIEWDKDADEAETLYPGEGMSYDFRHIVEYLNELSKDIYEQPLDKEHVKLTEKAISELIDPLKIKNVLDVGCGQGNAMGFFRKRGIKWEGLTLGKDYDVLVKLGVDGVSKQDMHFISGADGKYDLIFARHILEHSPMPLLALMEWHRVGKKYLLVIVPNPDNVFEGGINHYYMLRPKQWEILFERAGWHLDRKVEEKLEYRFLLIKK